MWHYVASDVNLLNLRFKIAHIAAGSEIMALGRGLAHSFALCPSYLSFAKTWYKKRGLKNVEWRDLKKCTEAKMTGAAILAR